MRVRTDIVLRSSKETVRIANVKRLVGVVELVETHRATLKLDEPLRGGGGTLFKFVCPHDWLESA